MQETEKEKPKFWIIKMVLAIFLSIFVLIQLIFVVFKPYISTKAIDFAKKYTRGRFVCTLNSQGEHVGRLYKINGKEEKLIRTVTGNSCIFSRPKVNAGFFIFASGGGGGATPFESGKNGEIISKHRQITEPVIVIKVGKGGSGTYVDESNNFIDAKDGESTTIDALKIVAEGGFKSTRMTPLGSEQKQDEYHIPEKYYYLYDISKSAKYGLGGQYDKRTSKTSAKAQNGHSGAVIIQW